MLKALGVLFLIALDIPVLLLRGLVLSWMWLWFMVPLGLSELTLLHALGVSFLLSLLLSGLKREEADPDSKEWWAKAIYLQAQSVMMSLIYWGFGYATYSLM